ncbi:MAG: hypothetical protein ABIZ91_14465 [Gemmatimonadaceae bacterium]
MPALGMFSARHMRRRLGGSRPSRRAKRAGGHVLGAIVAVCLAAPALRAQAEFARQVVLVNTFESGDRRLGLAAAGALRARLQREYNRREVVVLGSGDAAVLLEGSGIDPTRPRIGGSLSAVARMLRADEIVAGTVVAVGGRTRLTGRLILTRDDRLVEPLPSVEAPTLDSAVALLAHAIAGSRRQLAPQRRCENHLRAGAEDRAVAAAREGIALAPRALLARTCLLFALEQSGAPSDVVVREADLVLAAAPANYWALDAAARARDALGERDTAAALWLRLAATDSLQLELGMKVGQALVAGSNARHARPMLESLTRFCPDDMPLRKLLWQELFATRDWPAASEVGLRLLADDDGSRADSGFVLLLGTALKSAGHAVQAVVVAADGVLRFPGDARLYVLYTDLVQAEAPFTIERGLGAFPGSVELLLLQAQALRRSGRREEALAPPATGAGTRSLHGAGPPAAGADTSGTGAYRFVAGFRAPRADPW